MQRRCDLCAKPYEAKRSTSKYCSNVCRARASQGASRVAVAPSECNLSPSAPDVPPSGGEVEASTRATLEAAGRLESPLGQAALILARRLDNNAAETGAGAASLAKQFQATLEAATANAKSALSPLDELKARRDLKIAR